MIRKTDQNQKTQITLVSVGNSITARTMASAIGQASLPPKIVAWIACKAKQGS